MFESKLNFKNITFPTKIRNIHKIKKKNCVDFSTFGYENQEKYQPYMSKNTFKKHVDLLILL